MQLLVLAASCLAAGRLLLFPPPKSARAGTPHNISTVAFLMTAALVLFTLLSAFAPPLPPPPPASGDSQPTLLPAEPQVGVRELQFGCLESLLISGILVLAMELPRLVSERVNGRDAELEGEVAGGDCPEIPAPDDPLAEPTPVPVPVAREAPPPIERPHPVGEIWTGIKVGLAALVPAVVLGLIFQYFAPHDDLHPYLETLKREETTATVFWVALAACLFAPLKEELMFRVILQGRLVDRFAEGGLIAAACLFAAVHRMPDGFMLIPLALMLGVLYERRRTFLSIFSAHAAFNGANMLMALAIRG
jgi:hypothetical protein